MNAVRDIAQQICERLRRFGRLFMYLPVSRAHNNNLDSPMARYFVIHDTSGPNYG